MQSRQHIGARPIKSKMYFSRNPRRLQRARFMLSHLGQWTDAAFMGLSSRRLLVGNMKFNAQRSGFSLCDGSITDFSSLQTSPGTSARYQASSCISVSLIPEYRLANSAGLIVRIGTLTFFSTFSAISRDTHRPTFEAVPQTGLHLKVEVCRPRRRIDVPVDRGTDNCT